MKGNRISKLISLCAAFITVGALFALPANAGTLTAASLTTNGSGYATTNASNTRYDWRYTTATSGTTSRVEATVPTGTKGSGFRYLALRGIALNIATTPDSAANSVTGDLDVRAKVSFPNWNPGTQQTILSKWIDTGSQDSFAFTLNGGGVLSIYSAATGTAGTLRSSTVSVGAANGATLWVRSTIVVNNGSNQSVATFYTSADGVTWNQLGANVSGAATSIYDGTAPLTIGAYNSGNAGVASGKFFSVELRNGIDGPIVSKFDPADYTTGTTFASSSPQTETWTINRSGTLPADIAYDLSVAELSGLPSSGTATYRLIDNKVVYVLPTPTSVPAGTSTLLALSGFTNTANSGPFPSTITTFDNSATPLAIDSVTTGTLAFTDFAGSAVVGTTVDPTFSFTVATHAGACNLVSQTAGVTTGATGVALGRITSATPSIAAQDLSIGTNANTGFNLLLRSSGSLTSGINTIADAPGTNATPTAFPPATNAAFGYTVSGLSRFSSAWAGATTTNQQVMTGSTVGTVTNCIAYKVQVTAATPAGTYATTAIYTAVPSF